MSFDRKKWKRDNPDRLRLYKERGREKNNQRVRDKREFIRWVKLGIGCQDCGYSKHHVALDFDHVRGKKDFEIGYAATRGLDRIALEMMKCEVVCSNCHRIRTYQRQPYGLNS